MPHKMKISKCCPRWDCQKFNDSQCVNHFSDINVLLHLVQCSNCQGVGGLNPLPHLADPPISGQNSTPGGRVSTPHLSFAEVGMLLDSHFLLIMQFLKYLGLHHDDLNVTTS